MKSEFALAFNEVVEDRQLSREVILEALESAMVSAYRRAVNASNAQYVEAKVDMDTGEVKIFAEKEVVEDVQQDLTEVLLSEAKKVDPEAEIGDMVVVESTPDDFGRVAAQTARQVIQQRIREAEREIQLKYFEKLVGEIVSGVVQAVSGRGATIGLDKKAEGLMLRKDMIPRERLHVHDRIRSLIYEVKDSNRGPQILLSRAHRNFLRRLLENEVPEIYHGVVEIRSIAREPGQRAKVAVSATQDGIDPVGACVGVRGVRIQAIVRELHDEKIDVIEWSKDSAAFIAKAISPARVVGVFLEEDEETGKTATVVVPEDQLSLAIGRNGQNARLAAKLTGWRIDIKSLVEAATDSLQKLNEDPEYQSMVEGEAEAMEKVVGLLEKKAEGRPLPPEEYDFLAKFVDRVEKRVEKKRREEDLQEQRRLQEARATVPPLAFEINILDVDLKEHILIILQGAGYETLGDLVLQMRLDPEKISDLSGIGSKLFNEIQELTDGLRVTEEERQLAEQLLQEAKEAEPAPEPESKVETETEAETKAESEVETKEEAESVPEAPASKDEEAPAQQPQSAAPAVEKEQADEEEEEESEDFDEIFSYDAEKYGYFEPEKPLPEDDDFDEQGQRGKKKKKKRRSSQRPDRRGPARKKDDWDEWEDW